MKNYILSIIVLFLMFSTVSAFELRQDSSGITVIPEFDQPAKISTTIIGAIPNTYIAYTLTAVKLLPTTPFYLNANETKLIFDVYPTTGLIAQGPAAYAFAVEFIDAEKKQEYKGRMVVRVVRIEDALFISSESNNPDSDKISFYVQNKEGIDLKNVSVNFSSVFFNVEKTFDIDANSKTELSIDVPRNKLEKIEAGSYLLTAEFQTDRGPRTLSGKIYLGEKTGIESKNDVSGWIVRTNNISKRNYGNVVEDVTLEVEKDFFSRLFTFFSVEPTSVERNGFLVKYTWKKQLGAAESFNVKVKTQYLIPFFIIIAICLAYIGIKRYTEAKILILKSARPVKTSSGQFALKIKLHIKAKKNISNVSIIDKIPGIVQIYENFSSVVKPTKIDAKNKRIQWDLGDLTVGQERTLSYVVYSKVGVVGKFMLPQTLSIFEKDGKIHEVESNAVYFLAEQKSTD